MQVREIKDWMNFIVFSTTLCGNYENWKDNSNISEIININTNPMCANLKKNYPDVEDKVIQSIVLGFLCNINYTSLQFNTNNKPFDESEYEDLPPLIDLEVD